MKDEKFSTNNENCKRTPPLKKPEHGADSQLHCYNAVSWRLAEMFSEEEDLIENPLKPKN